MKKLGVLILSVVFVLAQNDARAQRTIVLSDHFLYSAPRLDSPTIEIKESNATESAFVLDSVESHMHTYSFPVPALKTVFKSQRRSFFMKVKVGDQIGYAHSGQLYDYGIFDYDQIVTVKNARLLKLYDYKPCTDGDRIIASFQMEDKSVVDLEIPFSYFYGIKNDEKEGCILLYHSFLINHLFDLTYRAIRSDHVYFCDGLCDWVYCNSITLSNNDPERFATVKGNKVNIRQGPSIDQRILGQLNPGDKFLILEVNDDPITVGEYWDGWVKIKYNDITGWIFGVYVTPVR